LILPCRENDSSTLELEFQSLASYLPSARIRPHIRQILVNTYNNS